MSRPTQQLCRQTLSRPIDRPLLPLLRENGPARCLSTKTIKAQRSSQALLPSSTDSPRCLTTSHARHARSSHAHPTYTKNTPPPPKRPRRFRILYAALFLAGVTGGTFLRFAIAPPAPPPLGSQEDTYVQRRIQANGDHLPIVKQLSSDPEWTSWDAYAGIPTEPSSDMPRGISHAQTRITSGPMSGSSGLAFQRIFHNASTGEVVTVVYFGGGLAGWPGVVHGGALATVLDESLGRCALLTFPSRTGVTANLELQYRAPTMTNNFYIIRAKPIISEEDAVVGPDGTRKCDRKLLVQGTLETKKGGDVCIEAKALFVVPKGYQLRPLVHEF